jgi:hypothetical protein
VEDSEAASIDEAGRNQKAAARDHGGDILAEALVQRAHEGDVEQLLGGVVAVADDQYRKATDVDRFDPRLLRREVAQRLGVQRGDVLVAAGPGKRECRRGIVAIGDHRDVDWLSRIIEQRLKHDLQLGRLGTRAQARHHLALGITACAQLLGACQERMKLPSLAA